ncbi:MAG: hypothetical protein IKT92_04425 [Bacteroidaceae bacterium]|jgi:hypothetical protein|nr:hypothetical protein [Bacteroidaceae bacterium]
MKQQYLAPVLKVANVELQGLIAASATKTLVSDQVTNDDASMNNKLNNDWKHTWE